MKLIICAIRDSAIGAFNRPIFVQARGQAVRSFQDEVNRLEAGNDLANHPSDFELYCLGEWDDQDGKFEYSPELLVRAKDVSKTATLKD